MTRERPALRLAALLTLILPGLFGVASAHPALSGALGAVLDAVIWPIDGAQGAMAEETRFLAAVLGGIIAGWGVMIWCLAGAPLARDGAVIRPIIRTAILTWFVLDSAGSVLAGAPLNVAANVVFAAMFLVPLALGARAARA